MEITVREVIFSIIFLAILFIGGFGISNKIQAKQDEKLLRYSAALQTDRPEEFSYWISTDVGDVFVEGDVDAVGSVQDPKGCLTGNYMYISCQYQEYAEHSRLVSYEDDDGNTHWKTEYYWTWDDIGSRMVNHVKYITFCGQTYTWNEFPTPGTGFGEHVSCGHNKRYEYHYTDLHHHGTLYTCIEDKTIFHKDMRMFYGRNLEETYKYFTNGSNVPVVLFWVAWIILMAAVAWGFYYLDNEWLE